MNIKNNCAAYDKLHLYLDLEFVLVVGVVVGEVPELLGLVEAPLQVLGGYKVLRHLDAVVDVAYLNNIHIFKMECNQQKFTALISSLPELFGGGIRR